MLRHLLKLIWKRKTRNLMLSLEILLAFVIVFAVAAFATRNLQLYRLPVGYQVEQLWSARILADGTRGADVGPALYDSLQRALRELPEVEAVAFASHSPLSDSTMRTSVRLPASGRTLQVDMVEVNDDFFALAGMQLQAGRWFSAADDGAAQLPAIVNRRMAEALFPGQDALGKVYTEAHGDAEQAGPSYRITGIVDDYRSKGALMTPPNVMLVRFAPLSKRHGLRSVMLRVKPGTGRDFEQRLHRQLKAIRNDWGYDIAPLTEMRAALLREQTIPLIILAVIGAFMLVMVAFGLFGVLWQNTTRRIPEIGLRRAVGASGAQIYRQIVGEQLLISSAAMLVALALLVQLPLTGALGASLSWPVFGVATAGSMAVIYLLSLLCALYPGWRASRLSPTEALHYE